MKAAGADDDTIARGLGAMGSAQTGAYRAGVKGTFDIHFDYRDTTNLDEMLRNVTGFHFWATRNIPAYMRIMATHPGVFMALQRMEEDSEQYREEEGVASPRFNDSVPLFGLGRQLAQTLFGEEGELWWDPHRFVALAEPPGNIREPSKGESPVGRALDVAGGFGVSPHPFLNVPLNMLGVYGARQPGSFIRATPVVNAAVQQATGENFDLEGPVKELQRQRPLNALGANQPEPRDPDDVVAWRLREMSQERTGRPNHPAYIQAAREGNSNPLFQEAVRSLGNRGIREKALAATGVASMKLYTDTQHEMDQRRKKT
jgi:hypothetical protein